MFNSQYVSQPYISNNTWLVFSSDGLLRLCFSSTKPSIIILNRLSCRNLYPTGSPNIMKAFRPSSITSWYTEDFFVRCTTIYAAYFKNFPTELCKLSAFFSPFTNYPWPTLFTKFYAPNISTFLLISIKKILEVSWPFCFETHALYFLA